MIFSPPTYNLSFLARNESQLRTVCTVSFNPFYTFCIQSLNKSVNPPFDETKVD